MQNSDLDLAPRLVSKTHMYLNTSTVDGVTRVPTVSDSIVMVKAVPEPLLHARVTALHDSPFLAAIKV